MQRYNLTLDASRKPSLMISPHIVWTQLLGILVVFLSDPMSAAFWSFLHHFIQAFFSLIVSNPLDFACNPVMMCGEALPNVEWEAVLLSLLAGCVMREYRVDSYSMHPFDLFIFVLVDDGFSILLS